MKLQTIIEEWIGEDRNDFELESYGEPEKRLVHNSKILGHNQALKDLKQRIPELVEAIVKLLDERFDDNYWAGDDCHGISIREDIRHLTKQQ